MPSIKLAPGKNRGFTLIETLFVLGLLAILGIAIFLIYPSVRASRQAISEQANLNHIATSTKHTFLLTGYQGLNNDIANQAMLFPSNMNENNFTAGQEITSSWGSSVTIGPSTEVSGLFRVVYEEVPQRVCLEFTRGIAASYERVLVNDVAARDMIGGVLIVPDAANIITLCDTNDPITIRIETR